MAFITFEYTEARQRCLRDLVYKDLLSDEENRNRKKVQLFGEDMKMLAAWEPTDTIWENLGIEERFKAKAKCGFCFLITIIILIVTISFTSIQSYVQGLGMKYGANLNCVRITADLEPNDLYEFAKRDKPWTIGMLNKDGNIEKGLGADFYSCYCQELGET